MEASAKSGVLCHQYVYFQMLLPYTIKPIYIYMKCNSKSNCFSIKFTTFFQPCNSRNYKSLRDVSTQLYSL